MVAGTLSREAIVKPKQLFLLGVILISLSICSHAQPWSGIIDPTRAVNWQRATVGVPGGIPTTYTQCG
jgi:hypothetical protein